MIKTNRTYHQLVGDLGDDHAKREQVQAGVMLKQLGGRLLEDDEGQGEDEADVHTRTEHAGVLHSKRVSSGTFSQHFIFYTSQCDCVR